MSLPPYRPNPRSSRHKTPRNEHVVGRISTVDGTSILIVKHVAKRYRERVEPELAGWPEALTRLRYRARHEGVITEEPPEWYPERDNNGRQPPRWLLFNDCALSLRGRVKPKAVTVMTP